jgi:TonB-dependent SusC/RagA subfamily outer membrane receptor
MRIKFFILILLSFFCVTTISAQKNNKKVTITGTVLDKDQRPIANAIIMLDGKNTSSVTDEKGKYQIKVKPGIEKIGVFTFGNGIKEEPISGRTEIDFNFATASAQQAQPQEVSDGEQGVNTGYGSVKNKNMNSPSKHIDGTNKKYGSYTSVSDMIVRETSGVKYTLGGQYIIQDSKNLQGSIPALLVLDGVYVDSFDGVSPSSVLSIEVLKGSSATMYGSRGYGGVILVKTKIKNQE